MPFGLVYLEQAGPIFLVALFAVVFGGIALLIVGAGSLRIGENLQQVAKRYGGTVHPGGFLENRSLSFFLHGCPGRLYYHTGSDRTPAWTRFEVKIPIRGHLRITPEGFFSSIAKLAGAQDVQVGDSSFDDSYVIKADSEEFARRILTPQARRTIQELEGTARSWGRGLAWLQISGGELSIRLYGVLPRNRDRLLRAFDLVSSLVGGLCEAKAPEDVPEAVAPPEFEPTGSCPVCAGPAQVGWVRCRKCGIHVHEECWEFSGKCPTFGCGEARFRRT